MKQKKVWSYGIKINKYKDIMPKKYYIINMEDPMKPKVIAKFFDHKNQAKFCIGKFLKADFKKFDIVNGQDIIDDPIDWHTDIILGDSDRISKYDYPSEIITIQEKKTWRTMYRYYQRKKKK